MEAALKIRGIYATALTRLFLDQGLTIVSPSEIIARRFKGIKGIASHRPVGVEICDLESGQGILVQGHPEQAERVISLIKEVFFDVLCRTRWTEQPSATEFEFPYLAKSAMDELRNNIMPTVFNHHRLRIIASEYVDLMERMELTNHPEKRAPVSRRLEERLIWDTYQKGKVITIDHVKPNGHVVKLSEGEILEVNYRGKGLTLRRAKYKGGATYDGLNIPKEDGDYAITEVKEGNWFYKHTYLRRDGRLIGEYNNINTPVEFYPDKIRYVDLEIDVVRWPDGKVEIIDEGELDKQFEQGYLSKALKETAKRKAQDLLLSYTQQRQDE